MVTPGIVASSLKIFPGDYFGSNLTYAYSLTKLFRNPFNTFCLRVRRSSDNTTLDIGFTDDNWVDVSAIETFVGSANTGYLDVWYNQSDNTNTGNTNLNTSTSLSTRPIICEPSTGVPTDHNGKPVIKFTAVSGQFIRSSTTVSVNTTTFFSSTNGSTIMAYVGKGTAPAENLPYPLSIRSIGGATGQYAGTRYLLSYEYNTSTNNFLYWDHGNFTGLRFTLSSLPSNFFTANNQRIILGASSTIEEMYYNGSSYTTQTPSGTFSNATRTLALGAFFNGTQYEAFFDGYMQEYIVVRKSFTTLDLNFINQHHIKNFPT